MPLLLLLLDSLFGEKKKITRILKNADTAEKEKAYFLVELETRARVFNARFDPVSRARRGFISLRRQTQRVLPPIFVYFRGNARRLVAERREDTGLFAFRPATLGITRSNPENAV